MPDFDNATKTKDRNEPRAKRDKVGDAGHEGYTVEGRRAKGDLPGYISSVDDADEMDRMTGEGGPSFGRY